MDIISELLANKVNYFLSVSDNLITCGGYDGAHFVGLIEIEVTDAHVTIQRTVTHDTSSSTLLSPDLYTSDTGTYKQALALLRDVQLYLALPKNRIYQDTYRSKLLANTSALLADVTFTTT